MASHFLGLFLAPKNGKSLLVLCRYARFRVCRNSSSSIYWPMHIPAQRTIIMGNRGFLISVAQINYGLH